MRSAAVIRVVTFAWLVLTLTGCGGTPTARSTSTTPATSAAAGGNLTPEAAVRAAIVEILKVKGDQVVLDQPFSAGPLKADELDVIEIVMATEERLDVSIEDTALDQAAGVKYAPELPSKLTPRMLIRVAEQAKKNAVR